MSIWEMSISGAVMIVAIVVIRALAINRLPKKTFLALWGIALFRLLIPYSLPSVFSVYSLAGRLTPMTEDAAYFPTVQTMLAVPTSGVESAPSVNPWTVVWQIGVAVCATFFAATYWKCRRQFRESLPVENGTVKNWLASHRLRRTVEIRQTDRVSAPLTYGVLRPVILLTKRTDWEDETALAYVLAHEYVHIRRFDAVTKLVLTAAVCVHWFNPAVWLMYALANRDIELSCDEAVVRLFGERTKSAYAMTLIRMEETKSNLTLFCNNFSKHAIEERIVSIMKMKKTSVVAILVAIMLIVGVATGFATSGQTAAVQEMSTAQLTDIPSGTPLYGLEDGTPAEMASGTSSFNSGALDYQKGGGNTINVWYQNTNDASVSVILYRYNSYDTEQILSFQVAAGEAAGMSCSGNSVAGETYLVRIEVYESGIGERRSPEISGALLVTQSD